MCGRSWASLWLVQLGWLLSRDCLKHRPHNASYLDLQKPHHVSYLDLQRIWLYKIGCNSQSSFLFLLRRLLLSKSRILSESLLFGSRTWPHAQSELSDYVVLWCSTCTFLLPQEVLACLACWPLTCDFLKLEGNSSDLPQWWEPSFPNQRIPLCCCSLSLPIMDQDMQSHLPALFYCKQIPCHPRNSVCEIIYEILIPLACKWKGSRKPVYYWWNPW